MSSCTGVPVVDRRTFCRTVGRTIAAGMAAPAGRLLADEDYRVYSEVPRLLLRPQRLRLLRRERERESPRWLHFDALISGKAQMAEPGFALSLHYMVSGSEASAKRAIQWALAGSSADVRQIALVCDWCGPVLSEAEKQQIGAKLHKAIVTDSKDVPATRNRAFAAIAYSDLGADVSAKALERIVKQWWRESLAPALKSGARVLAANDTYALLELLHVMRDNLQIEFRDDALTYFRDLPASQLLSYYPARYPAPENEYRIPFYAAKGDPDLRLAALSRAADMSFVAYDNNVVESQFIQGWVLNDAFQMRSTFGSPYEYLWANPYQPGLSYHHMPLRFHDPRNGRLFVRSSWEEDATWAAYVDTRLQVFQDGKIQAGAAGSADKPAILGTAALVTGSPSMKWRLKEDQPAEWFIVRLKPEQAYEVEVDDEELAEMFTDRGGILPLKLDRRDGVGVQLRERKAAAAVLK